MRASTDSSNEETGLLFNTNYYLDFGKTLMGTGATYDYSDIGPHILIIILIPIAVRSINRKATNTIMSLILFAMIFSPYFCKMFNGFGYVTFRWSYSLLLFMVWSAAEQIDADKMKRRGNLGLAVLGLLIISIWTLGLYSTGLTDISRTGRVYVPTQIISGILIILVLLYVKKKGEISKKVYVKCGSIASIIGAIIAVYIFRKNLTESRNNR